MPLFVLGFLACAALRTTGVIPEALGWITHLQVAALGAALFGMGGSVEDRLPLQEERRGHDRLHRRHTLHRLVTLAGVLLVTR